MEKFMRINVENKGFYPPALQIYVMTDVTWFFNEDGHSVTFDNGSVDSDVLPKGSTFTHVFNTLGVFPYHCKNHGEPGGFGMSATVTVIAPEGS